MSAPVLPWAAVELDDKPQQMDAAPSPAKTSPELSLEEAGLAGGDKIEVKWRIEPAEAEAYDRWWRATIAGPSNKDDPETQEPEHAHSYQIQYEAYDDFTAETSTVVFTSKNTLLDVSQDKLLLWKADGAAWELTPEQEEELVGQEEDSEGSEAEEEVGPEGPLLRLVDVHDDMVRNEREWLGGKTLEQAENELLGTMQPAQRITVAAGYREFTDKFVEYLKQKVESGRSSASDVVVTADDVRDFSLQMAAAKRQRTS